MHSTTGLGLMLMTKRCMLELTEGSSLAGEANRLQAWDLRC